MNSSEESIYFYAENGPFLLCYSENIEGEGARPLSSLYVSDVVNSAPTSDRSIVVNGLITLFTHTHTQDSPLYFRAVFTVSSHIAAWALKA